MRTIARIALAAALAAAVLGAATPAPAQDRTFDPKSLTIPKLNPIPQVKPERTVLPNGVVLYMLEDHELPIVTGSAYFKASLGLVPAERTGIDRMTGEVMRSGGSATRTGDFLDDRLGAIGASVSSYLGADFGGAEFRCLSGDASEVMGLFAEVLRKPAFPDDKVELAKVGLRREIASRNDEMMGVLRRVATQSVYGRDTPWGRIPEYATIEPVTADELRKLHAQVFVPERMILVVFGDFKAAEMKKLVQQRFGDWKKSGTTLPPQPPKPDIPGGKVVFAPKDDVTQSGIVLAHPGFLASDPDLPSMDVLEQALGGGFQSRLFNLIRTQRGLAYATGATAGSGYFRPGVFLGFSLTRNDSVMVATDLLRQELTRVTKEPFTDEETRIARESVENSLVFQFAERSAVVSRAAFYELAGYPPDFLQRYQKSLATVTPQTVLAAAQRRIHPDQLQTVIVGKEKEFDRPLESLGKPVERVDISIPPPPSKVAVGEATPASLARGQEWLKKAADLAGGPAAWSAVNSWSMESQATLTMQGQSLGLGTSLKWRKPDRMVAVQKLPMGEFSSGYDGTMGWMQAMGQVKDEPKMAQTMKEEMERSMFGLFADPTRYQVQALDGTKAIDGIEYKVAVVRSETVRDWQLYFAPDGKLTRMEYQDEGPAGPAMFTTVYDDWRPVGGLRYPFAQKTLMAGEPFMDTKVTDAKLNPPLADDLFKRPPQ
jgi:zinc protease